jgi:ketosteroid isomerase-like protein
MRTMVASNGEATRAFLAAFNRGELDTALELLDPYAVVRFDPKWPENRPRFGAEEIRVYFDDLISTFGTGDSVIEELIEAGDRVVARYRARFKGQGSGVQDDVLFTQLLTFRRGKIIEFEYFLDFDEALAAAGLSKSRK